MVDLSGYEDCEIEEGEEVDHIAVKAYQVPTCTGTRSPILLRLVCGRTPVATLGMWADPGRAFANGGIVVEKRGCSTLGMKACKHYDGK